MLDSLAQNTARLDYYSMRTGWARARMFGDILPDHPVWGPVWTGLALVNLVLKVVYLPAMVDLWNRPSVLSRWLDEHPT